MRCVVLAAIAAWVPVAAGCADDVKRPIGATCGQSRQCEAGICGGGFCLDPLDDTDNDGLTNAVEARLGTDPVREDTDGDALRDDAEVGSVDVPSDADADGRIDALESATADCDGDTVADQDDATDGLDAKGICTFGLSESVLAACEEVCDAAAAAGCEGFVQTACLAECRDFVNTVPSTCGSAFVALATCLAQGEITCAAPDSGNAHLPELPEGACDAQATALGACGGQGAAVDGCETPTRHAIDNPLTYRVSDAATFFFDAAAGVTYQITVSPDPGADFDLFLYADIETMCGAAQRPLDSSLNGAGEQEVVTAPPLDVAGRRYILVDNFEGGDVGFELNITVAPASP